MKISAIVATGRNGEIGLRGKIPWRMPRDLDHFRKITWGNPIIMGRKTHDSIGKCLPGRWNIVLTSSPLSTPGAIAVRDVAEALDVAGVIARGHDVMVIGGARVFGSLVPLATTIHLTVVDDDFEADTYFPFNANPEFSWAVTHSEVWLPDTKNIHRATYIRLDADDVEKKNELTFSV